MNIVFCADRKALPGLHVSIYSVLANYRGFSRPDFKVLSDVLDEHDASLLCKTLDDLGKDYSLKITRVDPSALQGFPQLNGSLATYFRLLIPSVVRGGRYLYLDADLLCDADVSPLNDLDLEGAVMGAIPEAPLSGCADRGVAALLGGGDNPYFNAGILLVDADAWRREEVTRKLMEFLSEHSVAYCDQSALNVILDGKIRVMDERFNTIANMRKHWRHLRGWAGGSGRIIHFVEYPKPWDLGAEFLHPQYRIWRTILDKTMMRNFRSWQKTPCRRWPRGKKAITGYKKAIKDRLLFAGYECGWLKNVKGT